MFAGFGYRMTSVLKKSVFSSGITRLVPSLCDFSGIYFICLYLSLYQRTKKSKTIFFTHIYSYSFMSLRWWLRLLPGFLGRLLLYCILLRQGQDICKFSKPTFGLWEGSSIPVLLLFKLPVVLTYRLVLIGYLVAFECHLSFFFFFFCWLACFFIMQT